VLVTVSDEEVGVSVPYHFTGAEADEKMERALAYASVLAEVGGFTVWAPPHVRSTR
jgi:hypothetical protein